MQHDGSAENAQARGGSLRPGDLKNQVLAQTDLVPLVSQTVRLIRRGKSLVGLCPFHQEKTPSFNVDPARQYFHCFGCGKAGNAIDFVMQRDRVDFLDALRRLAEAAGIEMRSTGATGQKPGEKQLLLDAQSTACSLFEKLLSEPSTGETARAYLQSRGFDADSIRKFRIGLAVDSWDTLLRHPSMRKFPPALLVQAGLIKSRDRGEGHYDTFRNRLMFPIRDEMGRIIAFGGRVMPGSTDPAKYLNSPETPLFSKSRCCFGLDLAKNRIVESRVAAVVEGYTDVVMAHQYGASNVVSVLGTALTVQHVTTLRRFADRIVLLFDGDRAGENAAGRAIELFLTQPVEIAIASLPDGLDPDEFLLKFGREAFDDILSQAPDALSFKWKQLTRQIGRSDTVTNEQQAIEQYLQSLASARGSGPVDTLRWGAALTRVSRLTGITVDDLNRRFKPERTKARTALPAQVGADEEPTNVIPAQLNARQRAERIILGLMLLEPSRWTQVQQHVAPADFVDPMLREIAQRYWDHQQDEGEPLLSQFLADIEDEALKGLVVQCSDEAAAMDEPLRMLNDSLQYLFDSRRMEDEKKLIAGLRRNSNEPNSAASDVSSDIEALRKLQDKAKTPDLRRIAL